MLGSRLNALSLVVTGSLIGLVVVFISWTRKTNRNKLTSSSNHEEERGNKTQELSYNDNSNEISNRHGKFEELTVKSEHGDECQTYSTAEDKVVDSRHVEVKDEEDINNYTDEVESIQETSLYTGVQNLISHELALENHDHGIPPTKSDVSGDKTSNSGEENLQLPLQASKLKTHSKKSKIPHYSQKSSHADKLRISYDKSRTGIPSTSKHSTKFTGIMKASSDEELKQKYKSLFRSSPKSTQKNSSFDTEGLPYSQEDRGNYGDPLITDEDGSNLLVESGFFDNECSGVQLPESPNVFDQDFHLSASAPESSEMNTGTSSGSESNSTFCHDEEMCGVNEYLLEPEPRSDEAILREAEDELMVNLAIQNVDTRALLDKVSKSKGVRLMTRGFQALTEFSKDTFTHDIYTPYLSFVYSCLDIGDDPLKVEVLKVLLNLSRNPNLILHLLSTEAPSSSLKFFLLNVDEDIQLVWLAFVVNIYDHVKRSREDFKSVLGVRNERSDNLYDVLYGIRSSRIIKSRIYLLTRHKNRHITHVARQIYSDLSKKDPK